MWHYITIISCFLISCPLIGCSRIPGNVSAIDYNYQTLVDPNTTLYCLQPGDVFHVRVLRNDNISGNYTIRPDGFISLPLGGEIKVRNLNIEEIRERVVKSLAQYIENADEIVSVSLEQVRGISYSVIGEVNRPGMFENPRYVTILEALANAGGLTAYAQSDSIYVIRRIEKKELIIPFSYKETLEKPAAYRNFYLLSGDIVIIP